MMPMGRDPTWGRTTTPSALAASTAASRSRHRSGAWSTWMRLKLRGRPETSAIRRSSSHSWSSPKSELACSTPRPAAPMASAIPISSASAALSDGV
jgi:hypothetical protein